MKKQILLEINDHVATIILNRPERGNSLTLSMVNEFLSIFQELENNPRIRVIIITGKGKYFCTGMDLKQTATNFDSNSNSKNNKTVSNDLIESYEKGSLFFNTVKSSKKTTISKINGPVLGGGIGLMFVTDIRICNEQNFYFCFSEIKRGLLPVIISQFIVPELGPFKTKQYILTGEKIFAKQALDDRIISTITSNESELNKKVDEYTTMLLYSAPKAIGKTKRLIEVINSNGNEDERKNFIREQFLEMMNSEEAIHGIKAYSMKQKPDWCKSKM